MPTLLFNSICFRWSIIICILSGSASFLYIAEMNIIYSAEITKSSVSEASYWFVIEVNRRFFGTYKQKKNNFLLIKIVSGQELS